MPGVDMTESHEGLRGGMLGTLRSELDESDSGIDPGFETLSSLAGSVRTAFLAFRIGPTQAARIFATLRLQASDGNEWTVGPTSGTWYTRRRGETTWRKASMPIGITPVDNPNWLQTGIAAQLQAAETEAQAESEAAEAERDETPIDPFSQGALNPFQRKDLGSEIDGIAPGAPRTAAGGEDVDWIFEEWEDFDRRVRETRAATPERTCPRTSTPTRPCSPKRSRHLRSLARDPETPATRPWTAARSAPRSSSSPLTTLSSGRQGRPVCSPGHLGNRRRGTRRRP
jgi:hypothetical protein